jgi:hypothetical protein
MGGIKLVRGRRLILIILTFTFFTDTGLLAQTFTGTIIGRVLDQHQAVVPNATIILKNNQTGTERRTNSNENGVYSFITVTPGKYTIRAEASSFAPFSANLEVAVAASTYVDITLGINEIPRMHNWETRSVNAK